MIQAGLDGVGHAVGNLSEQGISSELYLVCQAKAAYGIKHGKAFVGASSVKVCINPVDTRMMDQVVVDNVTGGVKVIEFDLLINIEWGGFNCRIAWSQVLFSQDLDDGGKICLQCAGIDFRPQFFPYEVSNAALVVDVEAGDLFQDGRNIKDIAPRIEG